MPDLIKGTAVLDDRDAHLEVLFIVCVAEDPAKSRPFIGRINVRRRGTPATASPQWEYDQHGSVLDVSPSVRTYTTVPIEGSKENREVELFHNGTPWQIPFVRWSEVYLPDDDADRGRWEHCRRINEHLLPTHL